MSVQPGIDVHHHAIPPAYRDALEAAGLIDPIPGVDYPQWSVDQSLEVMDRRGIAVAILSITEPGVHFAGADVARRLAREVNEFYAELIAERPDRFGAFAALPLPDVDATLEELAYAIDVLGLDGAGLMTNYGGLYLGDERLDPVLAELARRRVPAFVHPASPPYPDPTGLGLPVSLFEFTFDTTRMVAGLLYGGALDRHPQLGLILSHAGGTVPFLAKRLTYGPTITGALAGRPPADAIASLGRLHYDTAMSASPYALPSLTALVDSSHILLGTDYPFMPEHTTVETFEGLQRYAGLDDTARAAIRRENALELFPRLRTLEAAA
jgi:predicted TIM-barrel fold metal-dependent hydrolase